METAPMSRVRSPNYPTIGLAAAIEKVRSIHKGEGKNAVAREALAKLIGYGGLNGGSATMLSALGKYGLLESVGDGEAHITDLAMQIIAPESSEEKQSALATAAFKPVIFSEIREKWPDRPPGDESLRSFLVRKGFTENALEQVIQFYREIIDIVISAPVGQNQGSSSQAQETFVGHKSGNPVHPASPLVQTLGVAPGLTDKPFAVAFDGTVLTGSIAIRAVRDIDRLIKILQAQKASFEAMQDEDSDDL